MKSIYGSPLRGWRFVLFNAALALGNIVVLSNVPGYTVLVPYAAGDLAGVTPSFGTWATTDHMIGLALGLPVARWFTGRFGDYRVYVATFAFYACASFVCATSETLWTFLPARIALGFAGGVILPVGQSLALKEYPERLRMAGVGLWGVLSMTPFTVGVFMGGWYAEYFGWRALFYSNIAAALPVAGIVGSLLYGRGFRRVITRFDGVGFFLLAGVLFGTQTILNQGNDFDWFASPLLTTSLIVVSIALPIFLIWEFGERHPVIDIRLFAYRNYAIATVCSIAGFLVVQGILSIFMGQLQTLLGYSSSLVGLIYLTMLIVAAPLVAVMHELNRKIDTRFVACLNFLCFAVTLTWLETLRQTGFFRERLRSDAVLRFLPRHIFCASRGTCDARTIRLQACPGGRRARDAPYCRRRHRHIIAGRRSISAFAVPSAGSRRSFWRAALSFARSRPAARRAVANCRLFFCRCDEEAQHVDPRGGRVACDERRLSAGRRRVRRAGRVRLARPSDAGDSSASEREAASTARRRVDGAAMTRRSACIALGLLSLLLAGCALTMQEDRAQFLDAPAMERTLANSGLKSAVGENAWPREEWWRAFRSAELDRIVDKALRDNQNLRKAEGTLRAADAVVQIAGARLLPEVQATFGMRQSRNPLHGVVASYNPAQGGLQKTMAFINPLALTWELDFWGKNRALLDAAIGEAAAQEGELEQARLLLTSGRRASLSARLCDGATARSRERADEAAPRIACARGNPLSDRPRHFGRRADRARQSRDRRKARSAARALLTLQQDALARLMGEGPDAGRDLFAGRGASSPAQPALPRKLCRSKCSSTVPISPPRCGAPKRPRNASMSRRRCSFPRSISRSRGGFEGSVTSTKISKLAGYLFTPSAIGYVVAPGVRLPIFQGGRLTGNLEVQRAEYDQAVDAYNETLLQSAQQVADSIANLKRARAEYEAQSRFLRATRAQLDLARVRLRDGMKDRREIIAGTSRSSRIGLRAARDRRR